MMLSLRVPPTRTLKAIRLFAFLATIALLASCATMSDRPTEVMVAQQLMKEKKLVHFWSSMAADELRQKAVETECGKEVKDLSTVMPVVGVGFIGAAGKYHYTVHSGAQPDGSTWVALRTDGPSHGSPMGYTLSPTSSGTDVTVYAADKEKLDAIRSHVEAGTLFCHWCDFSYPYD